MARVSWLTVMKTVMVVVIGFTALVIYSEKQVAMRQQEAARQVVRQDSRPRHAAAEPEAPVEPKGSLSYENYLRVRNGMTLSEVEAILGPHSEELSRVEIPNVPTTVSYSWKRWSGANMIGMFQDGRLTMKAQSGLD